MEREFDFTASYEKSLRSEFNKGIKGSELFINSSDPFIPYNQQWSFPAIAKGQATVVPYGQSALKAGFRAGQPITVSPNITIHVNGPNGIVARPYAR